MGGASFATPMMRPLHLDHILPRSKGWRYRVIEPGGSGDGGGQLGPEGKRSYHPPASLTAVAAVKRASVSE